MECLPGADDFFGPQVRGCRDDFDFTLLFEQSFFQIAPCALFLLSVPLRATQLRKQQVKTFKTGIRAVKSAAILVLACTQLALLINWSTTPTWRTRASIPAAALSFIASLMLLVLSSLEHARSVRPSTLINSFLLFSLLFDIPQARTLWLRSGPRSIPGIFTAGIGAKTMILVLEARNKRQSLFPTYRLYAPEALVGIYDRTVLWWLNPTFWRGYTGFLSFEHLHPVSPDAAADTLEQDFLHVWARNQKQGKRSLLWSLARSLRGSLAAMAIPRLANSAFKISQPLLINRVTNYLAAPSDDQNTNVGHGLIGATTAVYIGLAISNVLFRRGLHRFTTKLRGTLITAIYAKILVLPSEAVLDNAALTLVNTDVLRIIRSLSFLDSLIFGPLEIGAALFLLYRQVGVSCVAPMAFVVATSVVSFWNSNHAIPYQKKWLSAVQERVAYTSSALANPKAFKMMGLTDYLTNRIQALRVKELDDSAAFRKFTTWRNIFSSIPEIFAPPMTLTVFVLIQSAGALNATRAFTTLSLVSLLSNPTADVIHAVPMMQAIVANLERIQDFLFLDEGPVQVEPATTSSPASDIELRNIPSKTLASHPEATEIIILQSATVLLGKEQKLALQSIDLVISKGTLTTIVGPVGSGKSTLLRTLVGDLPLAAGRRLEPSGSTGFAYCAQNPWLPNDTLCNIITSQYDLDEAWLEKVITACALHVDVAAFPQGRETVIGSKGISLSGGQRQRLALARAVYARRRIILADDPLSGLDNSTSSHVFAGLFGANGLCRTLGMSVVLATNDPQHLAESDHILALNNIGQCVEQGTLNDLIRLEGYVSAIFNHGQGSRNVKLDQSASKPQKAVFTAATTADLQHDLARKTGDMAVYKYYFKSIGWTHNIVLMTSSVFFATGMKFSDIWVKWWANSATSLSSHHPREFWIGIYFLVGLVEMIALFVHIWWMLVYTVAKSSAQLHKQLLDTVMRAPYNFFVKTDLGITMNRFSNDMTLIEMDLTAALIQLQDYGMIAIGTLVLIMISSKYAAILTPFVLLTLYVLQKFYLRTSRQLRFMDIEAMAPLFTHCQETISGSATIRAFGWQSQIRQKCLTLLDNSQRAFYLQLCVQRWLTLILDLLTAGVAIVVVAFATSFASTSSAGSIGVSLLNILSLNAVLSTVITQWTALETSLGAVARIKNFEKETTCEDLPCENHVPAAEWPQQGKLEIHNLSATYDMDTPDVLKGISLSIAAGEKVGFCGRSGSGKSSFLLSLVHMLELSSGSIVLDGVDLSTVPRQILRERLTALPQESIILPGTVRVNMDPLETSSDADIRLALDKVGLLDTINQRGGLEAVMDNLSLSCGQCQLFAVARTLLRKSKVLLLDEMTSSVDAATEQRILEVINTEFPDSTIISVAHRLKTIVDYDKVVVMVSGKIVEIGAPRELLEKRTGHFKSLWDHNGH